MPPALPADADYDALCEALMASSRGRWFLEEYAKRNRNADTGLVLDAIARVEAVVRTEQAHQATQGVRIELLEMARTIAQTRADVAEAKPERSASATADSGTDVFAAAGRLQEVAWTMRERGLDMAMCDQIADLSTAILSASSLRNNPNDGRALKLAEVLSSLERRFDAMLRAAAEPPPSDGAADRVAPEQPEFSSVAEATPQPVELVEQPAAAAAALPEAALSFPAAAEPEPEPEPIAAEPEPASEHHLIDIEPISVKPHTAPVAAAAPEPPPPAPPPAAALDDAENDDDFLLAPLPLPGTSPAPMSEKPADPLAAMRTLSAHELIALFT
jgi:hypothetical protein